MKHYHQLLSYGDLIELETRCDTDKLLKEIKDFEWTQYNPRKKINRYGLSVTSSDGTRNGIDLDSIYEHNRENGTRYDEDSLLLLILCSYVVPFKYHNVPLSKNIVSFSVSILALPCTVK